MEMSRRSAALWKTLNRAHAAVTAFAGSHAMTISSVPDYRELSLNEYSDRVWLQTLL